MAVRALPLFRRCLEHMSAAAGKALPHQLFHILETQVVAVVVFLDDLEAPGSTLRPIKCSVTC